MPTKPSIQSSIAPIIIGIMLIGLVFSKWLLSASQILLILVVLSDKTYRKKLLEAFKSPLVIALISIYLFLVVGLAWTEDYKYAFKDLQIKLPMLSLVVIFYAIGPFKRNTSIYLLLFFVFCVFASSLSSTINYYTSESIQKVFIIGGQSHIRFSLLVCLSILIIIHYFNFFKSKAIKIFLVFISFFLIHFLFILNSLTGYIVLASIVIFLPFLYWKTLKNRLQKVFAIAIPAIILSILICGFIDVKNRCFPNKPMSDFSKNDTATVNGNLYRFDSIEIKENGNLVYEYISEIELINSWNKISSKKICMDSIHSGEVNIILRYLTSKNLRKDSVGISKLTESDIKNIEQGCPNFYLADFDPYRKKIYVLLWEINYYKATGNPNGLSLIQRCVYWKTALSIIKENPIFGVGTGDIANSFKQEYEKNNTGLEKVFQLRSHNQYMSIAIQVGIVGLLIFLFSIFSPFILKKIPDKILYIGFIFIFLLSMLNEDTLETQVGVTFYALFNSFLLFILPNKKDSENETK